MKAQNATIAVKSPATPRFSGGAGAGAVSDQSQLPLEFYAGPPDPAGHVWCAFTLDTPEEEAAAVFLRRYGRQPEYIFESRGNLLAGPIPSEVL